MTAAPILKLMNIRKDFGEGEVLQGIDLSVMPGEFLTLLGPSGCGKTTTLRIIAGLEAPSFGRVLLDGTDVTDLPPEKRAVNTVFQNYALFPHMNVAQNIAYGLKLRHVPKVQIREKVQSILEMVQLQGFEKRMPGQLSGGQRQRVAIARALVLSPRILLLDEPLGALDLQLRRQMQNELKRLQKQSGITFIYITHDQEEALNMSDRIAVMRGGYIEQMGTPEEVYEHPASIFAATFIGQTNLLYGVVTARRPGGGAALDVNGLTLPVQARGEAPRIGERIALCLRTEQVHYGQAPQYGIHLSGIVKTRQYTGGTQRAVISLPTGQEILCLSQNPVEEELSIGSRVFVWWNPAQAAIVPLDDEEEAPVAGDAFSSAAYGEAALL